MDISMDELLQATIDEGGSDLHIRAYMPPLLRVHGELCPLADEEMTWDRTKPDGTPRKLCDTSLIRSLGWSPKIDLATGLRRTVDEYRVALATGNIRL